MKTNIQKKYKDRPPLETIKIITNFFLSEGYQIEITDNIQTEANTFWCHINLKDKDNNIILGTNGKGTTNEYSLASGHAELYERYCAGFHLKNFLQTYQEINSNLPIENSKFLTFKEILDSSSRLKNILKTLNKNSYNYCLKTFAQLYNQKDKIPCSYFSNLDPKKQGAYFNEELILALTGSDGTAAGNTLEEAIVQGLSEVYEHYVTEEIFKNQTISKYYELDVENMQLSFYLVNLLYQIKQNDNISFHIFDLSYNFNMPVILGTFHDKQFNRWFINLGASPVFEIALERTLTEVYQGAFSLRNKFEDFSTTMVPFRSIKNIDFLLDKYSSSVGNCISLPEALLLKSTKIKEFNKKIFLSNNEYSNKELLDYYINIGKINNFETYFKDMSKTDQIKAVRVFVSNKDIFSFNNQSINFANFKNTYKVLKIYIDYLKTNNFDFKKYQKIRKKISKKKVIFGDIYSFIEISNLKNFQQSLKEIINNNNNVDKNKIISYYLNIYNYKINNKYNNLEIEYILKNILLFDNVNKIDIINVSNIEYWFKKIFLN